MAQWPNGRVLRRKRLNYQRVSNNISRHSSAAETSGAAQPGGYHWITFFFVVWKLKPDTPVAPVFILAVFSGLPVFSLKIFHWDQVLVTKKNPWNPENPLKLEKKTQIPLKSDHFSLKPMGLLWVYHVFTMCLNHGETMVNPLSGKTAHHGSQIVRLFLVELDFVSRLRFHQRRLRQVRFELDLFGTAKWWFTLWLCQNSYWKSHFLMGKSTINGHSYWKWPFIVDFPHEKWWFSIAMLVYQRVISGVVLVNVINQPYFDA